MSTFYVYLTFKLFQIGKVQEDLEMLMLANFLSLEFKSGMEDESGWEKRECEGRWRKWLMRDRGIYDATDSRDAIASKK